MSACAETPNLRRLEDRWFGMAGVSYKLICLKSMKIEAQKKDREGASLLYLSLSS